MEEIISAAEEEEKMDHYKERLSKKTSKMNEKNIIDQKYKREPNITNKVNSSDNNNYNNNYKNNNNEKKRFEPRKESAMCRFCDKNHDCKECLNGVWKFYTTEEAKILNELRMKPNKRTQPPKEQISKETDWVKRKIELNKKNSQNKSEDKVINK